MLYNIHHVNLTEKQAKELYRYDDAPPQEYEYSQPHTSTDGTHKHRVWLYDKNLLYIGFMIAMI